MKTRKDKIGYLKGLISGTRFISEIRPGKVILFIKREGEDFYKEVSPQQRKWSIQEIDDHKNSHAEDTISIINIGRKIISKDKNCIIK